MSGRYKVGVVGATGAVGSTILQVLGERGFPVGELVPFASERSVGREVAFAGQRLACRALDEESVKGLDVVLSSAGGSVSAEWAPRFVDGGAYVVDNTSYWRLRDGVPLVVAEVNPEAIDGQSGIIANPNCSAMQLVVALAPIHRQVGIERIVVSTYQSVSGTGAKAMEELRQQSRAVLDGGEVRAEVYPHQIAFNVLPQVEVFDGGDDYTTEERKMMAETRKILGAGEELGISATCARVPVFTGHSESVNIRTKGELSPEDCRNMLAASPGIVVMDAPGEGLYPLPTAAAGQDNVLVGRIRRDPSAERTLNLWVVGDNLRKGAATNAVQLAELLAQKGMLG
jgi:aspartate-semialdehyde dehydrogenase